jgi:hypothetical protein
MRGALIWLLSLAVAMGYTPPVGIMHSSVVVRKPKVVEQGKKDVGGISISLAGGRLVQFIDDEYQIGLACDGEGFP